MSNITLPVTGPLRDRLQSLIDELNAADKIRLLGWKTQAEVADLLKAADILLAPSVTTRKAMRKEFRALSWRHSHKDFRS